MKLIVLSLLLAALFFTAHAFAGSSDPSSEMVLRLDVGGRTRTALIHVPQDIDPGKPLPLVIVLHGGGGDAASAAKQTGLSVIADREKFIVAYPNGTSRLFSNRFLTWNAGACCDYAQKNNVDDVGFIRAMIADIQRKHAIDSKRIYATGISNGGMMSYRLACEMSDVLAAIAPVAAVQITRCTPSQPVSVIHFHGTADQNVLINGGVGTKALNDDVRPPVADSIRFWARHDACGPAQSTRNGHIHRDDYQACSRGTEVVYILITGGGHAWPGGQQMLRLLDKPTDEISASDTLWDFFRTHPKS